MDLNAGLIWSLQTQGPSTYDDAVTFAKDYKIQSTTPNGVVVSLGSWRIPTHEEVEFLRDRARYATGAIPGTATPADSTDGPGDYGQVTQGLQRLGFKNVREAFTSSSNGGDAEDGGVWYRSWKTPWSSDYLYRLSKRTEIQLNHESGKEAYKGDSDKRPFLMCRQIFSVLNNVNEPGGAGGDGSFYTDTPSELKPKSLPAEWYPGLGVITGVSQPGAITVEKVATTITYAVNTGHAVTIGDTVSRNAGSDDQTLANSRTYEGTVFTFPQNFVWFTTPPGSPLTVSNLPAAYPARDSSGNPVTYPLALNRPGTAGSQIWNTSDGTTTFEVPVTANVVGYDGTNFPVVLSSTNTIRQVATNNSGQPRRPTRAQVSPRNRVYDSTFTNSPIASETYGLTVFFDNKTVESKTADASWEIVSMVNSSDGTPYTGGGISVSNVGSDEGLLQVTLASVPTTGVDFQVKATVVVDGVTLSDTVKARVIGTP